MIQYAISHYSTYFLVLLRMVAFVGTAPVLSMRTWPVWSKIGLAVFLAFSVTPGVDGSGVPSPFSDPGNFIVVALQESVIGMALGFLATMIFSLVSVSGQIFDVQIGFGSALLFDPSAGQTQGVSGTFFSFLFTLYFLGMNGLDGMLLAVMNTYHFIAIGHLHLPTNWWQFWLQTFGMTMTLAVELAAPLVVSLLMTDVTFALLSRAVPQMNVFVVELPAKLYVGLMMFAIAMPGAVYLFGEMFSMLFVQMNTMLKMLGG